MSALLSLLLATTSILAGGDPPVSETVPIDLLLAQNQPIALFYDNVVDPNHPKLLRFEGVATNKGTVDGVLNFFFDWTDLTGLEVINSQVFQVPVGDSAPFKQEIIIPFCPPQVSLHLRLANTQLLQINGTFTHTCIPEASTLTLLGSASIVGLIATRFRRRRTA
jgi:hypothetical protein